MAKIPRPQMLEGQSTHRPPLFTGSDYGFWKTRMTLYIKAQDYHVWRVIAYGPHIPTKTVERATIIKLETEWNEADVKLIELNCKAMSSLYCAFDLMNSIESQVANRLKKFGINLKLPMKEKIKLRNLR